MPPPWVVTGTGTKAATAVGGCALLLGLAAHSVVKATSSEPTTPAPLRSAEVTAIVGAEATLLLEPECDCAPLWECMQKESGACGLLEKQLRDCLAKNKRT